MAVVEDKLRATKRLDSSWGDLRRAAEDEFQANEARLAKAEQHLILLHDALEQEVRARIANFDAMASNLNSQTSSLVRVAQEQFHQLEEDVPNRIASYNQRLELVEELIEDERELRAEAIERERLKLSKQLEDFQEQLQLAKEQRLESEALALQKIVDEYASVGMRVDEERSQREATLGFLRDENDQYRNTSEKPNQIFRKGIDDRLQGCLKGISKESEQLALIERQILDSLDAHTQAMQAAVRLVNQRPRNTGPFT